MPSCDPYCPDCRQTTGGCWRHNGTGIYIIDREGSRMTYIPDRIPIPGGWLYYLAPIDPPKLPSGR